MFAASSLSLRMSVLYQSWRLSKLNGIDQKVYVKLGTRPNFQRPNMPLKQTGRNAPIFRESSVAACSLSWCYRSK